MIPSAHTNPSPYEPPIHVLNWASNNLYMQHRSMQYMQQMAPLNHYTYYYEHTNPSPHVARACMHSTSATTRRSGSIHSHLAARGMQTGTPSPHQQHMQLNTLHQCNLCIQCMSPDLHQLNEQHLISNKALQIGRPKYFRACACL